MRKSFFTIIPLFLFALKSFPFTSRLETVSLFLLDHFNIKKNEMKKRIDFFIYSSYILGWKVFTKEDDLHRIKMKEPHPRNKIIPTKTLRSRVLIRYYYKGGPWSKIYRAKWGR